MGKIKNSLKEISKRTLPKNKAKAKSSIKPEDFKTVKAIQKKYDKPIQKPKKEIAKIKSELKSIRKPLYDLNRKLKKETRKTYADKLKREIRKYEKTISKPLDELIQKRKDVRFVEKKFDVIRKEKAKKRGILKRYDRLIDKAEENNDYKEVEKLTYAKIKELGNIDEFNAMLGMPVLKDDSEKYKSKIDKDKKGFIEDAANPLTIWEAIEKLNEDRKSMEWDYIIVNDKKISTNSIIELASESSSFWLILKQSKTRTPHVLRFFNLKNKTVKYEPYK